MWLFVGVNGVGKTTTIGKVGKRQADQGRTVVMAAGDTFRAAAAEQLTTWAERAGADLVRGAEGGDPSSVIFDAVQRAAAQGADLVLADTAGRLHTKVNLMEELRKVRRIADRDPGKVTEVLLVLDATTGQNGLVQAQQFTEAVDLTGVVLTKLDGSAKGGIALGHPVGARHPDQAGGPRREASRTSWTSIPTSSSTRSSPLTETGHQGYPSGVFTLIRLLFLPAKVGVGTTKLGMKAGYRTGRLLGYRRLFVFGAGVAVGMLFAPMAGRELRAKLQAMAEERRAVGGGDLAEKVRYELSHSPRTWHLPQPEVEVIGGTAILPRRGAARGGSRRPRAHRGRGRRCGRRRQPRGDHGNQRAPLARPTRSQPRRSGSMDDGRDHQDELTLAPATVVRTPRRRALWGVLAAVGVAAGALVVVSADDGTNRPGLPVALGLGTAPRAASGAEDSSMPAWITYVAGDDLPALGGEAPAYRLAGAVSEDQVRALADALGLDGDPVHENGLWGVTGDTGTLEVYEGGGAAWWFTSGRGGGAVGGSGGSTGSGCAETTDDVVTECTVTTLAEPPDCGAADGEGCFPVDEPTCDGPTEDCAVTPDDIAVPPAPAADLPSEDEARAIALDLLAATGRRRRRRHRHRRRALRHLDGQRGAPSRRRAVGPGRDGGRRSRGRDRDGHRLRRPARAARRLPAPGHPRGDRPGQRPGRRRRPGRARRRRRHGGTTGGDPGDTVVTAEPRPGSDPCVTPEGASDGCGGSTVGEPSTTTTIPACKVQPDGSEICETVPGVACPELVPPADDPLGAPETVDCPSPPDHRPGAAPRAGRRRWRSCSSTPSRRWCSCRRIDGSTDAYLVPGYRFTAEDGGQVDLPAVADESLTTPTTTDTTVPPDTGGLPDPGGKPPVDPEPCGPPLVEEDESAPPTPSSRTPTARTSSSSAWGTTSTSTSSAVTAPLPSAATCG